MKILIALSCLLLIITGCENSEEAKIGHPDGLSTSEVASEDTNSIEEESRKITYEEIDNTYTIIDVRTESEYNSGHIPGAILLPVQKIDSISLDKDIKIVVYCRSGGRSKTAYLSLVKMGYTNVYDLGSINNYTGELEK